MALSEEGERARAPPNRHRGPLKAACEIAGGGLKAAWGASGFLTVGQEAGWPMARGRAPLAA